MAERQEIAIGVDIGGTFTDVAVRYSDGRTVAAKALTTPDALVDGVLNALRLINMRRDEVTLFVHGTTAGLNAVLERRFASVGLITTAGFRDVYEIGRANRPAMYDLYYHRPEPLVSRAFRLEVMERMNSAGEIIIPLDEGSLRQSAAQLVDAGVGAIAVVLLHAPVNPLHEKRCGELLNSWYPQIPVALSHRVANEGREYERTSTTVVNAAVSATVDSYLQELEQRLRDEGIAVTVHVMQSNGGMTTAWRARRRPVTTLLSGPVGGAIAAAEVAVQEKFSKAIAVDMGGTSFDVSLVVGGRPQLAREAQLEGQPLLLSVVDVHTIGAGGGSIAWESGGGLRVGPKSAGALPGPACYGLGGVEPTVTDANVFLNRVNEGYFLGGGMRLQTGAAVEALKRLGARLGLGTEALAAGILEIVNARMGGLIRQITIGRGLDPREFALIAFGGAGPMHAIFLAEELGVSTVLVPFSPGTLSAQGMLVADALHDIVHPFLARWDRIDHAKLDVVLNRMRDEAQALLAADGVAPRDVRLQFNADVRYVGQEHSLTLPFRDVDDATLRRFHRLYRQTFGHSNPEERVELVTLRLMAAGRNRRKRHRRFDADGEGKPYVRQEIRFREQRVTAPRFLRGDLYTGQELVGPLVVDESSCTTVVPDGWRVKVNAAGVLRIEREG